MKVQLKNLQLRMVLAGLTAVAIMFGLTTLATSAGAEQAADHKVEEHQGEAHPEHGSMGAVGAKLANPLSDLWNMSMNFETPKFFDGNVNNGDPRVGADMIFQPVMPLPLFGSGDAEWRMITRPIIPLIFSQPIPTGFNQFDDKSGIGDIQLPMMLSLPSKYAGKFIFGAGPVGLFPTATDDALGSDQWALGPAVVVGYKFEKLVAVLFPNYFWKIASSGQDDDTPDISQGTLLYALTYNLANAWQVGMNPTISYNDTASSGNKWNVPVGLFVGKTVKMGNTPVNIKLGLEYSVVSPDDFGKRAVVRLQITPVISSLIKSPIFGGG